MSVTKLLKTLTPVESMLILANLILFGYYQYANFIYIPNLNQMSLSIPLTCVFIVMAAGKILFEQIRGNDNLEHHVVNGKRSLRYAFFFVLMILFHFNFKTIVPLINPHLYDDVLIMTDGWFTGYIAWIDGWRDGLTAALGEWINGLYLWGYLAMFLVSFVFFHFYRHHSITKVMFEATFLTSMVGTITYALMPAIGPFLYTGEFHMANLEMWAELKQTGQIPQFYYFASLAAMPSLHLGHAAVFLYMAWRYFKLLLIFMVPMTGWILIDAVYLQWHYVLDLWVGLLIAVIAIVLVEYTKIIHQQSTPKTVTINDYD